MAYKFLVKEVALQAGLSTATVDRVLNDRPGVRQATKMRVQQAWQELERQRQQQGRTGRRLTIDLVMDAPVRFSRLTSACLIEAMQRAKPAVLRAREHVSEDRPLADWVAQLDAIGRKGSHGVLLKAPNVSLVQAAVARLEAKGIPVVTLVTDLDDSARTAYVGLDNGSAGRTAAYLMGAWLGRCEAAVLVSSSGPHFRGEEERIQAFLSHLHDRPVHLLHDGKGLAESTYSSVCELLAREASIEAVYSVGGANISVLRAFAHLKRPCRAFIGHDLDVDNRALLREGKLSAVLHHDLTEDLSRACHVFMARAGIAPFEASSTPSRPDVITPFNMPLEAGDL